MKEYSSEPKIMAVTVIMIMSSVIMAASSMLMIIVGFVDLMLVNMAMIMSASIDMVVCWTR